MAYFDASVTLLFFLLTGRYLDHLMRARARSAVSQLLSLTSDSASVVGEDGVTRLVPARSLRSSMMLAVAAGERFAADGIVESGESEVDGSLMTGETLPQPVGPGSRVHAGMLNLTGPLRVNITAAGNDTFLSEIVRLMSAAEQGKSRYVRMADRLARIYAPVVHVLALITLIAWLWLTGGNWNASLMTAIAVLIITCPCALGLAVPAVHVVASGVLFRNGAMIKDGAALEKLAAVDTIVFDKTGTLTLGRPRLVGPSTVSPESLAIAAGLAQASRHPLSKALCDAARKRGIAPVEVDKVAEHPGRGMSGSYHGHNVLLGSRSWCGLEADNSETQSELVLAVGSCSPVAFHFEDELRPDAHKVVAALKRKGFDVRILSGDRMPAVRHAAVALGVETWQAEMTPHSKLDYLNALAGAGRKILMVGDGLNDAPALAAGFTSMAPSSATDIGRTAADTVFFGDRLYPIAAALDVAAKSGRLCRQNFIFATGYNLLAVPIAMAGLASPLIAAIAMSTSSLIVIANALRVGMSNSQPVKTAAESGLLRFRFAGRFAA
jgi:Cu2+-exporting ATPase